MRLWAGELAMLMFAGLAGAQALPPSSEPAPGPVPFPASQETPLLTPPQLDNLVAPIALYPDQLLSQILAASTYPLEIVDAEQWLQQNRNQPPAQLVNEAKQQNWDPSIQALVAFPDVLDILGRDARWTTDLGNAFLAQQADVMGAIQRMRGRAQQSGQLQTTPQQTVSTQYQDGQTAVQIAPTDTQVVYVPVYQPYAVWGPPAYGAYPSLWYPPAWGVGAGFGGGGYGGGIGFSPGVFLGSLFSGLLGFGGWGWGLNWFAHALFLIPQFFAHFGFHGGGGYGGGYGGGLVAGHTAWVHDPVHRLGVAYGRAEVANRFGGRTSLGSRAAIEHSGANQFAARNAPATNHFESRSAPQANAFRGESQARGFSQPQARSFVQSPTRSFAQPQARSGNESRKFNEARPAQSQSMARNFAAPQQHFSAPQQHLSAPQQHNSAPQQHFSAPHASAPHAPASHGSSSHASNSHGSSSHGGGHSSGHHG